MESLSSRQSTRLASPSKPGCDLKRGMQRNGASVCAGMTSADTAWKMSAYQTVQRQQSFTSNDDDEWTSPAFSSGDISSVAQHRFRQVNSAPAIDVGHRLDLSWIIDGHQRWLLC